MANLLLAKIEDHVSGRQRDLDIEIALQELEKRGYVRENVIRRILLGFDLDAEIISTFIRITGFHDGMIINRFPKHLQDAVESTLKEYYRRRDQW